MVEASLPGYVSLNALSLQKQVDVLPSKNQALCDLIYVIINGYVT